MADLKVGHDEIKNVFQLLGEKFITYHMTKMRLHPEGGYWEVRSCHIWRHCAATALLEAGMDLRHLHAALGHANLNTVALSVPRWASKP